MRDETASTINLLLTCGLKRGQFNVVSKGDKLVGHVETHLNLTLTFDRLQRYLVALSKFFHVVLSYDASGNPESAEVFVDTPGLFMLEGEKHVPVVDFVFSVSSVVQASLW